MKNSLRELVLTLPSFGWLFVFFCIPACIVYALAFRASDDSGTVLPVWTLHSILAMLDRPTLEIAWRTVWLSVTTTLLCVLLGLPVAYYMASVSKRRQRLMLLMVVIPLWSCFLVRIFAWKVVLHPEGFLRNALVALHVIDAKTSLMYNNAAVLMVLVYSYLPFAILPLYSAASKFDFHLFEAAMDLGASRLQAFRSVFIPVMRPAMLTAALIVFIPSAGAYAIPDVIGGRDAEMLGNAIVRRIFVDRSLPDASALALFLSVLVLVPATIASALKQRRRRT